MRPVLDQKTDKGKAKHERGENQFSVACSCMKFTQRACGAGLTGARPAAKAAEGAWLRWGEVAMQSTFLDRACAVPQILFVENEDLAWAVSYTTLTPPTNREVLI